VAAGDKFLQAAAADRTVVIASTTPTPTGSMVGHPERSFPTERSLRDRLEGRSRPELDRWVDAGGLTRALLGDAAPANIFLLGVAVQAGCVPVTPADIEEAIDLNGVAVEANLAAFRWGRRWAVDPAGVESDAGYRPGGQAEVVVPELPADLARRVGELDARTGLGDVLGLLAADLVAYQDAGYAAGFLDTVERVAAAEAAAVAGSNRLTETVARMLHKLLAYKDEYEVARLMLSPEATAAAEAVGGPGASVAWRLHPPLLRRLGLEHKIEIPTWTAPGFRALQRGKRLRGTPFDPFGRSPMRRLERELAAEYRSVVDRLLRRLTSGSLDDAVAIAALPDGVRGYEDIKARRVEQYRRELAERLARYESTGSDRR
jgi:indolepyruvate ferredoxin oxidoreductase